MKKNYFMLAAATMLFAACAETDVINDINEKENAPQAIGFETFVDKATRTGENTTALNLHHESFKVWGYKMVPEIVTAFDEVTISYNSGSTNNATKWEYSPLRYWDKTATSYEFYAATPINEDWEIVTTSTTTEGTTPTITPLTADNYYLTLNDFTLVDHDATDQGDRGNEVYYFNDSDIDKDLMVATSQTKNELVDFTFSHILSRLDVTVVKDEDFTETITVTEFQVCNLFGKGNYTQKATPTWETIDDSYITYNTGADCEVSGDEKYLLQSLIIPQTATHALIKTDGSDKGNNPYIWIQYTIQDKTVANSTPETFNAYYNLADVFGDEDLAITEGYRYTLGITISPNAIEFNGNVTNWVSQSANDIEIE